MSKPFLLVVIFTALAGLVVFPYLLSSDRVQRLTCLHNQEAMMDAVVAYQADNAGTTPRNMGALQRYYRDPLQNFACCPADCEDVYSYDPASGRVTCPNPAHRYQP